MSIARVTDTQRRHSEVGVVKVRLVKNVVLDAVRRMMSFMAGLVSTSDKA